MKMTQNQKEIEFIVGQQYKDSEGNIWKCICTDRKSFNSNILINNDGEILDLDNKAVGIVINGITRRVEIIKHIVPKKEVWINFYDDSIGNAFETKEEADNYANIKRKDCIQFIEK